MPRPNCTPARTTAASIAFASVIERASGFSQKTCLPWSAAKIVTGAWKARSSAIETISTSPVVIASRQSAKVVWTPCFAARSLARCWSTSVMETTLCPAASHPATCRSPMSPAPITATLYFVAMSDGFPPQLPIGLVVEAPSSVILSGRSPEESPREALARLHAASGWPHCPLRGPASPGDSSLCGAQNDDRLLRMLLDPVLLVPVPRQIVPARILLGNQRQLL